MKRWTKMRGLKPAVVPRLEPVLLTPSQTEIVHTVASGLPPDKQAAFEDRVAAQLRRSGAHRFPDDAVEIACQQARRSLLHTTAA